MISPCKDIQSVNRGVEYRASPPGCSSIRPPPPSRCRRSSTATIAGRTSLVQTAMKSTKKSFRASTLPAACSADQRSLSVRTASMVSISAKGSSPSGTTELLSASTASPGWRDVVTAFGVPIGTPDLLPESGSAKSQVD